MWYVGIILACIGNILSSGGQTIQKYSQNREQLALRRSQINEQSIVIRNYFKQPLWLLGLIMIIIGSGILDPLALAFASQSVVASLCTIALIFNILTAHFLGEVISLYHVIGVIFIIAGSIMIIVFGNYVDTYYTIDDIGWLFEQPLGIVYFVGISVLICMYVYKIRIIDRHSTYSNLTNYVHSNVFVLCSFSGCLGSISMLTSKIFIELLKSSYRGDTCNPGYFILLFIITIIFVLSQLHYYSLAQKDYQALTYVPIFQCFFIMFNVLAGMCFFKEAEGLSPIDIGVFFIGLMCNIIGMIIIAGVKPVPIPRPVEVDMDLSSHHREPISDIR